MGRGQSPSPERWRSGQPELPARIGHRMNDSLRIKSIAEILDFIQARIVIERRRFPIDFSDVSQASL